MESPLESPFLSIGPDKIVHQTKYTTVVERPFVDRKGQKGSYTVMNPDRDEKSTVVGVFGVTADDRVILTKSFRIPLKEWIIQAVFGRVNPEETPEDAARRELLEEVGYEAGSLELIVQGPAIPGISPLYIYFFLARDCRFVGSGHEEVGEVVIPVLVPREEVRGWLKNHSLEVDAQTWVFLSHL